MYEQSIEDVRDFIINSRLRSNELLSKNKQVEFYSRDKLIQLLEDNTLNREQDEESLQHTKETTSDNVESQNGSNVLNALENNLEGLTLEIRESLYAKLVTALSNNYRITSSKQNSPNLAESDVCAVAKKIELETSSGVSNLYSYKLSGVEKVIDIEKQTRNRNLCEALRTEIELLRQRDKMQSIVNERNCQNLSNDLSVEAEPTSCKETQCQVNQSNAKILIAHDGNSIPTDLPVVASESEYFTCSESSDSADAHQKNETNILSSCTQDSLIDISKQKNLVEPTKYVECQSTSMQDDVSVFASNNHIEKNTIERHTDVIPIESCDKSKTCSTNADEDSSNKKRKRISESDPELSTICSSIDKNGGLLSHSTDIVSTCAKINPPRKKHKVMKIERASDSSTCGGNGNVTVLKTELEDSSLVRLNNNQDANADKIVTFVKIKIEPDETISNECDKIVLNENINVVDINKLRNEKDQVGAVSSESLENFHHNIMFKIKDEIDATMPNRCKIKSEVDVSQYSILINYEGNCNEKISDKIISNLPVCSPIYQNKDILINSADIAGTRAKTHMPSKKHENKNVKTLTIKVKNRSNVTLDKNPNLNMHETLLINKMKREPNETEVSSSSLSPTSASCTDMNQTESSREKSSTQESANDTPDKGLQNNLNNVSAEKSRLDNKNNQESSNILAKLHRNIMSKLKKNIGVPHYPEPTVCSIKSEVDVADFSMDVDNEENCARTNNNENNNEISLNKEKVSPEFEDSNKALSDSVSFQNSENIVENQTSLHNASTYTRENTESPVEENSTLTDNTATTGHNENNIVRKRKCVIDDEAFERERARLDKQFGRARLDKQFEKAALDKVLEKINKRNQESEKDFYIFGEHECLFNIVVPIIREYYPSYYIPDDLCYSQVLQRLQIDLVGADMCDDDIASYTRDSIRTMRYLCDKCIVQ